MSSIPKKLILYKSARHDPINIKYRHSSSSLSLSTQMAKTNFQNRYQTGIVLNLSLKPGPHQCKNLEMINTTSKLKTMKSCFIFFHQTTFSKDFAIKLIQRIFRTLKHLERIEMWNLESLQKDLRNFKGLLLQRSLRFLAIPPLKCSEDTNELKAFLKFAQIAERRRYWPHLNYFETDFLSLEDYIADQGILVNILEFLKNLKSCESLYKYLHFSMLLPNDNIENSQENAALAEILKMQPRITDISVYRANQIETLFGLAEHLESLQRITIELNDNLSDYLDMSSLGEFPALQEINLTINCNNEDNEDEDPNVHFFYFALEEIKKMTNLRVLSLSFKGERTDVLDVFSSTLTNLSELRELKLSFDELSTAFGRLEWPWLKDVFQQIGKKKKLKSLSLDFQDFQFKGPRSLFKSLHQSLGKLTQLSSLSLSIDCAEGLKDQDICNLATHLSKLTEMESLSLCIGKSQFQTNTFVFLMDCIRENMRILSDLDLEFHSFVVTKQCCEVIFEILHQMKSLKRMELEIGHEFEEEDGLNIEFLDAEVRKRMEGSVSCYDE